MPSARGRYNDAMTSIALKNDPVLRKKAAPVAIEEFGSHNLVKTTAAMAEAMFQEPDGIGIAAPQIKIPKQVFLVAADVLNPVQLNERIQTSNKTGAGKSRHFTSDDYLVFINPKIEKYSQKKSKDIEGCLSVRGIYGEVTRSEKIVVQYYNVNGKRLSRGASGLFARIIQHEVDHLNGTLFIDKANNIQKI